MYKVPLHILEGFIKTLEQSNKVLAELYASPDYDGQTDILSTILENNKQIELIKINFGFNG